MKEGAFFARCYSHFTGESVPPTHSLLIDSIRTNNHSNTINNCMKIFDKARLVPQKFAAASAGYPTVSEVSNPADKESVKVINYLFGVIQSFFEEKTFAHRPQTYSGIVSQNWDQSEDALYLVRALFEGSAVAADNSYVSHFPIDDVLKSKQSLTGKRLFPLKNNHAVGVCNSYGSNCGYSPTSVSRHVSPENWRNLSNWNWLNGNGTTAGTGPLLGVKVWPESSDTYYSANGTPFNFAQMPRSHGAGAIGSASYILKNAQYAGSTDGGIFNRRRIVKNAFSSFLCRDQPPLPMDNTIVLQRVSDYFAQNFASSQTVAFRESVLCASCHVTYDEAAAVYRNTYVSNNSNTYDWNSDGYTKDNYGADADKEKFGYDRMTIVGSHSINNSFNPPAPHLVNGSVSNPSALQRDNNVQNINQFRLSKPSGRLVFSDYKGNIVNIPLQATDASVPEQDAGIHELGIAMASTDQFYTCMTKRFFNHLSGIDISLENPNDTRVQNRSASELYYLENVIEPLAIGPQGLKAHKSLRRLVKDLISSSFYRQENLRGIAP